MCIHNQLCIAHYILLCTKRNTTQRNSTCHRHVGWWGDSCIAHWVHARLVYKTHQNRTVEAVFVLHKRLFPHSFCFLLVYASMSIHPFDSIQTRHGTHTNARIHSLAMWKLCVREEMCFHSFKLNQSHWECSTKRIKSNNFLFRQGIQLVFLLFVQCVIGCAVCVFSFFNITCTTKKMTTTTATTSTTTWSVEAAAVQLNKVKRIFRFFFLFC